MIGTQEPLNVQAQLARGIQAAKQGDRIAASTLLYEVIDREPKNELAWLWLSYVLDSEEDRRICLENVLTLNPHNRYARQGLARLNGEAAPAPAASLLAGLGGFWTAVSPLPRRLAAAFWLGVGLFLLAAGATDFFRWLGLAIRNRTLPYYLTPDDLWALALSVGLVIIGIVALNVAWALHIRFRLGYYLGVVLSLVLMLLVPFTVLIADSHRYSAATMGAVLPAIVFFLTLLSSLDADDEQKLASDSDGS